MQVIKANKLTKYYGKARGITGVDLSVNEGEIFGFIGPNGSGKSTTIRTLLNLIFPSSGQAEIFGMDIIKKTKQIKQMVGYIPSEAVYYDEMSVKELLVYSARFYGAEMGEWYKKLVEAMDLDTTRKIVDLSMGNRKKVAIIQAMMHKPKLLILDEPTSGLDPLMKQTFFDLVLEMNRQGSTVFFSSHILQEIQKMCRRVAIIKEGRILTVEDIDGLRARHLTKVQLVPTNKTPFNEDFPGISNYEQSGKQVRFLYSGDINELMKQLSKTGLEKIAIEEPTLEEVFMHYYEKKEG